MTDKKVSQLSSTSTPASTDLLHVATAGITNKSVTVSDFRGYADVRDYGAVSGADSTAAIQAAIDANDNVVIPDGTFVISDTVTLNTNNKLYGGLSSIIKLADSSVSNLTNGAMFYALSATDIVIDGISIDGNKANNDINDNFGDGIRIQDCQRVWIKNNYIKNVPRDGIEILRLIAGSGNDDIHIVGNTVIGSGAASQTTGGEGIIVIEGEWIVIADNICRNNLLRGIEVETLSTTITNVVISNNVCDGNARGIGVNGATQVVVSGNVLADNTDFGIDFRTSTYAVSVLSGNYIDNSTDGIFIENSQFITVGQNIITSCGNGIRLDGVASIVIDGNIIDISDDDGIEFDTGSNSNLIISNNYIGRSDQSAGGNDNVSGSASSVTFTGNVLRSGSAADYGVNAAGSGWSIQGNDLSGAGVTGEINDTSSNAVIKNNAGYVTEKQGTGSITSGGTTDVITHGLSITPVASDILIVLTENPTNTPGAVWVDTITSANFTVNCENDPGASNLDFSWRIG
jgi:parallel beta-helix repeat protein